MKLTKAVVREPGKRFSKCISTHPMRHMIDVDRARRQHASYVDALGSLGLRIVRLERDDENADSCFVEDTAVVHEGKALMCLPAEKSRRAEVGAVEAALSRHVRVFRASHPATVEGGDVLHLPDRLVCGLTRRTNSEGARQIADRLGVRVDTVDDPSIMHLKSYVSHVTDDTILVTKAFASHPALAGQRKLIVPKGEEYAANVLSANGAVIVPSGYPKTKQLLERAGIDVTSLEMTEFPKCDGAMTCLSILF
jgi:dimethylargininase